MDTPLPLSSVGLSHKYFALINLNHKLQLCAEAVFSLLPILLGSVQCSPLMCPCVPGAGPAGGGLGHLLGGDPLRGMHPGKCYIIIINIIIMFIIIYY